jgi:hypothetical protein
MKVNVVLPPITAFAAVLSIDLLIGPKIPAQAIVTAAIAAPTPTQMATGYQSLLREEIAHAVATPGDIENELRYLIAVIRA